MSIETQTIQFETLPSKLVLMSDKFKVTVNIPKTDAASAKYPKRIASALRANGLITIPSETWFENLPTDLNDLVGEAGFMPSLVKKWIVWHYQDAASSLLTSKLAEKIKALPVTEWNDPTTVTLLAQEVSTEVQAFIDSGALKVSLKKSERKQRDTQSVKSSATFAATNSFVDMLRGLVDSTTGELFTVEKIRENIKVSLTTKQKENGLSESQIATYVASIK